ncbi:AAA family ATPase [Candidatus Micrarchaeota archaeon]|nr:AAA family ATPase [Candidatus Micrarchaeota archaeon]
MIYVERVPSGVSGLDELIQGGFPRRRSILVSGACGTGKSILAMQFLYKGVLDYGEPGVFVTFDEMPEKLRQDMLNFGWDLTELEKNDLFAIVDATSARVGTPSEEENALLPGQLDIDRLLVEILQVCRRIGAKRLVIDSIPAMAFQLEKESEIRKAILKLVYVVAKTGMTSILTSEVSEQGFGTGGPIKFSKYQVEEYVADGVIVMGFLGSGSQSTRTLYIRKLRGTKHSLEIHPIEITDQGMVVKRVEDVFK